MGGDINETFLLETNLGTRALKLNSANAFPTMFDAEAYGLQLLRNTKTIRIPQIYATGAIEETSYLIMEYVSAGKKTANFWQLFGEQLAKLHQQSNATFGLDKDNYIGSLPQYNKVTIDNSADFYIENRLKPQFQMAAKNGYTFQRLERFYNYIKELIPNEPPALIHGDLWSGNFLVGEDGHPCVIDPAVAYAPREMDIAMMHLFGGFSEELFQYYNTVYPLQKDWKKRLSLWQLYYLLVHLNLFGSSYLGSVATIIRQYS
ncbi:aminoglycoside phosphotransferase [Neptunitalea chrysea]|uniref:Aminoglycoside phosphotransferase n=1 Tax=Neptunitalea chrysea TaxID=1647581 RepID=A0A9W6B5G0_9FLAO|nr:aminoglycoside phosphotransferase [Neptunitalea chrysea]